MPTKRRFTPPGSYSYSFDGTRGHLDHALATAELATQVTGVANWHINADGRGFSTTRSCYKTAAQQALNIGTPFRASDHDPVLIGLDLTPPVITYATSAASIAWPIGADATPLGDADHDGLKNIEELLYNANPLLADSRLGTTATIGSGTWHFDYRLRHTVSGYSVVPQSSTNLTQWTRSRRWISDRHTQSHHGPAAHLRRHQRSANLLSPRYSVKDDGQRCSTLDETRAVVTFI